VRINLYERFGSWDSTRRSIGKNQRDETRVRVEKVLKANDLAGWVKLIGEFKIEDSLSLGDYLPVPGKSVTSQAQKAVDDTSYAMDHKTPLARHWTEGGNNTGDGEREYMTFNEDNLNLITFKENSRKGGEGAEFLPYVKTGFNSSIAAEGDKNAKTILGKKFLDENNKEIP
jgi:hypothetical protein